MHPNEISLKEAREIRNELSPKDPLYNKKLEAITIQLNRLEKELENE